VLRYCWLFWPGKASGLRFCQEGGGTHSAQKTLLGVEVSNRTAAKARRRAVLGVYHGCTGGRVYTVVPTRVVYIPGVLGGVYPCVY